MPSQDQDDLREFSLRDLLYVLFRHKGKATLFFLLVAARTVLSTLSATDVYESHAKLIVRIGREQTALDPTAATGRTLHVSRSQSSEINSELEILRSRDLVERIVDAIGPDEVLQIEDEGEEQQAEVGVEPLLKRLGLRKQLPVRERAIEHVIENLDIGIQKNSNIIQLGYSATSPDLAQEIIGELIQFYLDKHIEIHQTPGSYDFFAEQTEHFRQKLDASEQDLRELRNKTGIVALADQRDFALSRIDALETLIAETKAQAAYARAQARSLQGTVASLPDTLVLHEAKGLPNLGADSLRARLYELRLKEKELAAKYVESSPILQAIQDQIVEAGLLLEAESPVRSEITHGPNAIKQQLKLEALSGQTMIASLEGQLEELEAQIKTARAEHAMLNAKEFSITRLLRDIERDEANFEKYSDNLEQARIYTALETSKISNIGILQPASRSAIPVGPRRMRSLAIGILFGLFGALGLAFVFEFMDQTIKTPEDAQSKLALPTLGSIPESRHHTVRPPSHSSLRDDTSQEGTSAIRSSEPPRWFLPFPAADHFKNLRTQIFHPTRGPVDSLRVVAVASSYSGAGVSTVAANLAASMADADEGKILLIDVNLQDPRVHEIFKSELSPGLADLLANQQLDVQTIQPSPVPNLDILAAGVPSSPRGVHDTEHFSQLFARVRTRYRMVIVDLPPVNENVITTRLAGLCDGVILVVETEKLRWQVVERAKTEMQRSNANLLGVVLNKRRYPIPDWVYRKL